MKNGQKPCQSVKIEQKFNTRNIQRLSGVCEEKLNKK